MDNDKFYDEMFSAAENAANKSKYSDPLLPNQVGEGVVTEVVEVPTREIGTMFVLNFKVTKCEAKTPGAATHTPGTKLAYKQAYSMKGAKERVVKTWVDVANVPPGTKKEDLQKLFKATVGAEQILVGQRIRFETGATAVSKKDKTYVPLTIIGVQNTQAERMANRKEILAAKK